MRNNEYKNTRTGTTLLNTRGCSIFYDEEDHLYYTDVPEYAGIGFLTIKELKYCVEEGK